MSNVIKHHHDLFLTFVFWLQAGSGSPIEPAVSNWSSWWTSWCTLSLPGWATGLDKTGVIPRQSTPKERISCQDKLTHADIIRKIADETQIAQKYIKEVLEAAVALVRNEMLAGRDFKLLYIGTFKPVTRKPPDLPFAHRRQDRQKAGHQHGKIQDRPGMSSGPSTGNPMFSPGAMHFPKKSELE